MFKVMHCSRKKKEIPSVKTVRYSQLYKCFIIIVKIQTKLMIFLKFPSKMTSCSLNYLGNISTT